jgi:hypothetical protein
MKIIITESQYNLIKRDIEEEYPVAWNVEEFKKLNSFNERIQYCKTNLTRISSGSSRIVYKIDDTKVLKLAKNKKGLAQNKVEIVYSQDYMMDDIVAKVFNYDENNLWLEMELARKLTPALFYKIVGFTFDDYVDGMRHHGDELKPEGSYFKTPAPDNNQEMWENDFISRIFVMMGSYDNIEFGDLAASSSYGVVKRDGEDTVVMVDYGLTTDVLNTYYKK